MSGLYLMTTIANRNMLPKFLGFYQEQGVLVNLITLGRGTAASEVMDYFGLESAEKAVLFGVVTDDSWRSLKKGLQNRFRIDVPGTGIAFTVPLASIGGKRELKFLTEQQEFVKGEEGTLKDTTHELLVVIANQGYSNLIMEAAKSAGAGGGTVIHARGTGMERAESFFGVSLASEKEIIFIVSRTGQRNGIMKAVMKEAGMESKAKSIIFSLPVTSTAGLRLVEDEQSD
ncbi:MAG: P-II family nitrogen regulator [Hungatella sp.]|nr:P-II family nitrogen regulator [Hungatella sp.]